MDVQMETTQPGMRGFLNSIIDQCYDRPIEMKAQPEEESEEHREDRDSVGSGDCRTNGAKTPEQDEERPKFPQDERLPEEEEPNLPEKEGPKYPEEVGPKYPEEVEPKYPEMETVIKKEREEIDAEEIDEEERSNELERIQRMNEDMMMKREMGEQSGYETDERYGGDNDELRTEARITPDQIRDENNPSFNGEGSLADRPDAEMMMMDLDDDNKHSASDTESGLANQQTTSADISKPYRCTLCNYSTLYKACLVTHMVKHSEPEPKKSGVKRYSPYDPFRCEHCSYTTLYRSCLETHMAKHAGIKKQAANLEKRFRCSLCSYTTMYRKCLSTHMSQHGIHCEISSDTPNSDSESPTTIKPQSIPSSMSSTLANSLSWPPTGLGSVEQPFPKLPSQLMPSSSELIQCPHCVFYTADPQAFSVHYNNHLKNHHQSPSPDLDLMSTIEQSSPSFVKPYRCHLCSFSSVYKNCLVKHMTKHTNGYTTGLEYTHSSGSGLLKCGYCTYSTDNDTLFSSHMAQHLEGSLGLAGRTSESLHSAIVRNIEAGLSRPTPSFLDQKSALNLTNSTEQQPDRFPYRALSHANQEGMNVTMPQARMGLSSTLTPQNQQVAVASSNQSNTTQTPTHTIDKPYKCHICSYSTVYENCLKTHLAKHSTDFKDILQSGMAVESHPTKNGKLFKCTMCSYSTMYKSCLATHLLRHKRGIFSKNFKSGKDVKKADGSNRDLECPHCSFVATCRSQVEFHLCQEHETDNNNEMENSMEGLKREDGDVIKVKQIMERESVKSEDKTIDLEISPGTQNRLTAESPKTSPAVSPNTNMSGDYECPECGSNFNQKNQLEHHLMYKHATAMVFPTEDPENSRLDEGKQTETHSPTNHVITPPAVQVPSNFASIYAQGNNHFVRMMEGYLGNEPMAKRFRPALEYNLQEEARRRMSTEGSDGGSSSHSERNFETYLNSFIDKQRMISPNGEYEPKTLSPNSEPIDLKSTNGKGSIKGEHLNVKKRFLSQHFEETSAFRSVAGSNTPQSDKYPTLTETPGEEGKSERSKMATGGDIYGEGEETEGSGAVNGYMHCDSSSMHCDNPSLEILKGAGGKSIEWYLCKHCGIAYNDCMLYTMHSGYHGFKNPFQCNFCGHVANNKYEFSLHIFRAQHN